MSNGSENISVKEVLSTLEVKDKILIVKGPPLDKPHVSSLMKGLKKHGCLGVICFDEGTNITALGLEEIEKIVEHMKKAKRKENRDE